MATLHLGVIDTGYTNEEGVGTTTGDVAGYLEADYHVMEVFYELNQQFIADCIANEVAGALENMAMGGPQPTFDGAMQKIEERFRDFISSGEMQKILPTTQPIKAAVNGVSHRKKTPYAKDKPSRVAFVDTGLYVASFRSWLTGKLN